MQAIEMRKEAFSVSIKINDEKTINMINVHGPNKRTHNFLADIGKISEIERIRDKLMIIGDWNAQIGKDIITEQDEEFIGKEIGFETSNENGEEFKVFLHLHRLQNISSKIGKNIKITWRSGEKQSQIDHLITPVDGNVKFRWIKGFWTTLQTDHKLIVAEMRCTKVHNKNKGNKIARMDASALKEDKINEKYHEALKEYEININPEKGKLDEVYSAVTSKMKSAANGALKSKKLPLTPNRKAALNRLNRALRLSERHPEILPYKWKARDRKQSFQEAVRESREKEVIKFFQDLNDYDVTVRTRKTYQFLKKYERRKNYRRTYIPMRLWNNILKQSEGPEVQLINQEDTCPLTEPPSKEEMKAILTKSCNGKTAGPDGIRMELIKYADEDTVDQLLTVWQRIWKENDLPKSLTESFQIPIPKVRRPTEVDHFRRISLCSVGYKPYAKWMRKKLKEFTGELDQCQAAFTEGRSTEDQIFIARRILEEYWNSGRNIIAAALDIKKAFDNVRLDKLKEVLLKLEVPTHVINRVLKCVKDDTTRIKWQNQESEEIRRGKGIKQGCPLSPFLFNLIMQSVLRKIAQRVPELKLVSRGTIKPPCILAFADDILVLVEKKADLEKNLRAAEEFLEEVGLEINNSKSKILMRIPKKNNDQAKTITLNGREYEICDAVLYLGSTLTRKLNRPETTRKRCRNAVKTSKVVIEFLKRYKPPWHIGRLIYNTVIAPAMLYGTKVTALTKRSRIQLAKYEKIIVKDIWNHCRKEKTSKLNIRKELQGKTINRRVRVGRIKYFGHITRRERNHPLRLAYRLKLKTRKRGRPSFTWRKSLEQDFERYDQNEEEWEELAQDKEKLRKKAEEIYLNEISEISDGEDEETLET